MYNLGSTFNISVSRSVSPSSQRGYNLQEVEVFSCAPSRALYAVNVTYSGGSRSIKHSANFTGSLNDMVVPLDVYFPIVPNCVQPNPSCIEQYPGTWPQPLLDTMIAFNHYSLIDALVSPMSGNYTVTESGSFEGGGSSWFNCGKLQNPCYTART
jgi:hypothetical protein